jgi:hypothetical protein
MNVERIKYVFRRNVYATEVGSKVVFIGRNRLQLTFVLSVLHDCAIRVLFELVHTQSVTLHSVKRLQHTSNLLKHCEVIKMPCHVPIL